VPSTEELNDVLLTGAVGGLGRCDVWDDDNLDSLRVVLAVPRPIGQVEAAEAWIKRSWAHLGVDSLDRQSRVRFARFFHKLGVLPKYKSYGVKYAAPFGYSLFDLQDGGGFSIQLHEELKIEAFHVLGVHPCAFILLCTPAEWDRYGRRMIELWAGGHPEKSHLAYRPAPGDVVVVENLSTVHTVVGCLVEEFATSSYDVVTRIHDQNFGRAVELPAEHESLMTVLKTAELLEPRRRVRRVERWHDSPLDPEVLEIVSLEHAGLVAKHAEIMGKTFAGVVSESTILTVVVLSGQARLEVDGAEIILTTGDVTALAPKSQYSIANIDYEVRISLCQVSLGIAFSDLRVKMS
jgi:hypothetical protein